MFSDTAPQCQKSLRWRVRKGLRIDLGLVTLRRDVSLELWEKRIDVCLRRNGGENLRQWVQRIIWRDFYLKRSSKMWLVAEGGNWRDFLQDLDVLEDTLADRNEPVGWEVTIWGVSLLMASVFTMKWEARSSVEGKRKRDMGVWKGLEKVQISSFLKHWQFSSTWW